MKRPVDRNPPPLGPDPEGHAWSWRPLPTVSRPDFGVYVHDDPDALLDALAADPAASEERLPYFASLWPAGAALASDILAGPPLKDRRVLDVGCGSGVVGLAAACRGADVTLLDRDERSEFGIRASAAELGVPGVAFVAGDWRVALDGARFDLVLAADVLYEPEFAAGVAPALARWLAPDGEAWIADPGRVHAAAMDEEARRAGLIAQPVRQLTAAGGVAVSLRRYVVAP